MYIFLILRPINNLIFRIKKKVYGISQINLNLWSTCANVVVNDPNIINPYVIFLENPVNKYGIKKHKLLHIICSIGWAYSADGATVVINWWCL